VRYTNTLTYLLAVLGVVEDDRSCAVSVTSSEPARITAQTSTRCGTTTQPWRLSAPAGQRIALGLLDFARPPATAGDRGPCRAGRRVWHRHIGRHRRSVSDFLRTSGRNAAKTTRLNHRLTLTLTVTLNPYFFAQTTHRSQPEINFQQMACHV